MTKTLVISDMLADEMRDWANDEREHWPPDTAYQDALADLLRQLDVGLPTHDDVRGILAPATREPADG